MRTTTRQAWNHYLAVVCRGIAGLIHEAPDLVCLGYVQVGCRGNGLKGHTLRVVQTGRICKLRNGSAIRNGTQEGNLTRSGLRDEDIPVRSHGDEAGAGNEGEDRDLESGRDIHVTVLGEDTGT